MFVFFPKRTVSFNNVINWFYLNVEAHTIPYLELENNSTLCEETVMQLNCLFPGTRQRNLELLILQSRLRGWNMLHHAA